MKVYLAEALTTSQMDEVDAWDQYHHEFSDHAFDNSRDHVTYIDLEHPQDSVHKSHVEDHLAKHGYKIHDYHAGLAMDKHNRVVKIGKALGKTGGEHLIEGFTGDPSRQQQKAKNDHMVAISRHPYDVAGMTSGGHSWEDSSCMKFGEGSNCDYLPEDVKHGTHVAYLIHKDDRNIQKPLARIALKPFHGTSIDNIDGDIPAMHDPDHRERIGNTILRPEPRTYGDSPDAFSYTVNRWANKHFPGKNEAYVKNDALYNDGGNRIILSDSGVSKAVGSKNATLRTLAASSPSLSDKHAMILAKSNHGRYHGPLARNPSISKDVAEYLWAGDRASHVIPYLMGHPKHGDHFINKALSYSQDHPERRWIEDAIASHQLNHKHVEKLMARPDFYRFKAHLIDNGIHAASGAQVSKLLDSFKDANHGTQLHYARRLINNKKTNVVVKHMIDGFKEGKEGYDNPLILREALIHPKSTLADYRSVMGHAQALSKTHPHLEAEIGTAMAETSMKDIPHRDEVLHDLLDPRHGYTTNKIAARHSGIKTEHINKILEHPDSNVRTQAFSAENVDKTTEAHHLKLLSDPKLQLALDSDDLNRVVSYHMRGKALDEAVNHPDKSVRHAAAGNPHLNIRHLDQLVNRLNPSEEPYLAKRLANHPSITPYHFDSIFRGSEGDVQADMLHSPHITAQHVDLLAHNVLHSMDQDDYRTRAAGSKLFQHPKTSDEHRNEIARRGVMLFNDEDIRRVEPHHLELMSKNDRATVQFRQRYWIKGIL